MKANDKIRELIAIGESITANCQPCLESHVAKALSFGADPREVAAAIEIGNRIRKGAAAKMDAVSSALLPAGASPSAEVVLSGGCRDFLGP